MVKKYSENVLLVYMNVIMSFNNLFGAIFSEKLSNVVSQNKNLDLFSLIYSQRNE